MATRHSTDAKSESSPILEPGSKASEQIFIAQQYALEANRRVESIAAVLGVLERAAEADGHVTAETIRRVIFLLDEQADAMAAANYRIADAFEALLGCPAAEEPDRNAMH